MQARITSTHAVSDCLGTCKTRRSHWGRPYERYFAVVLAMALALLHSPCSIATERIVLTFLRIQPDVRARGMGEAAVGLTEIISPYASNPGALALQKTSSLYAGGGEWLPEFNLDLWYYCAGLTGHIDDFGTVAFSVRYFNYGEIVRTTEFGTVDSYHSYDLALDGSVALALDSNLAIGGTISLIRATLADPYPEQDFGSGGATSVAFDFGILIHNIAPQATATSRRTSDSRNDPEVSPNHRFRNPRGLGFAVGLALQNLGPDINYTDPQLSGPIPRNVAMGVSYRPVDLKKVGMVLSAEVDGSLVNDGTDFMDRLVLNMGAEVSLFSVIDVRIGRYKDPDSRKGLMTLGFSVRPERVRLSVSYIPNSEVAISKTMFLSFSARI